jgi:iron-sulfur cluster insertion protein
MSSTSPNELPTVSGNTLPSMTAPEGGELTVKLTDRAVSKTQAFQQSNPDAADKALRLYIEGGGCSGFSYKFKLDDKRADDHVFEEKGVTVVIDPMSMQYVKGSTIDYEEDFTRSGFILQNPNASSTCGCGESFAV